MTAVTMFWVAVACGCLAVALLLPAVGLTGPVANRVGLAIIATGAATCGVMGCLTGIQYLRAMAARSRDGRAQLAHYSTPAWLTVMVIVACAVFGVSIN